MLTRLFVGFGVMAICVAVHAVGVTMALRRLRQLAPRVQSFLRMTGVLVLVAVWVVLFHLIEIAAWAALYLLTGAIADAPSAAYFSAVTYTTIGYGDIVLPAPWRIDAGMEALTGIIMCGWSTGFFFAVVSRTYDPHATAQ